MSQTFSRVNSSAATLSKNRTEGSVTPNSGMCVTCVDGCIGMCEIGKSAYRGHEVIYPQPFGVITTASEKVYPVDYSHFNIMGTAVGAQGIEADSDKAIFPNVDLEVHFGHDGGIKFRCPWIIPGIGSTNIAKNNWEGLAIGSALAGTGLTIGENVVGMDQEAVFFPARMDYYKEDVRSAEDLLEEPDKALISRYALGRDYHKVLRKRLQKLASRIEQEVGPFGYRVFVDSAPVLEKAIAEKAGLGWIGKHSNLLNRKAGSWFFLGEIYTDLPLPVDAAATNHCGECTRCIEACPTGAIIGPYRVDARKCISYLTIELKESIPEHLRPLMGNRIFGCDDCQMVCPWNRFAVSSDETDFVPRHGLDAETLVRLFGWTEEDFLQRSEGSAIRRTGYLGWLRNIAVALGNADPRRVDNPRLVIEALEQRRNHPSAMVREHVDWALKQQQKK